MNLDKVKLLDDTFQNNYKEIMRSANTICRSYSNSDVTDIVHNSYLKLRKKIKRDGFIGDNYMGYIWIAVRNEYGMGLRKKTRDKTVFISDSMYHTNNGDVNYEQLVDKALIEMDDIQKSSQTYDFELMEITGELFEYVELIFDPKEAYLFKNYYLTPKSTYRKLSARTGYSITDCSLIMKGMKRRIRMNFLDWYKTKHNGNE
jgi:hypothetical protein